MKAYELFFRRELTSSGQRVWLSGALLWPLFVTMLCCSDTAQKWTQCLRSGEEAKTKHTILIQTSQGKNRLEAPSGGTEWEWGSRKVPGRQWHLSWVLNPGETELHMKRISRIQKSGISLFQRKLPQNWKFGINPRSRSRHQREPAEPRYPTVLCFLGFSLQPLSLQLPIDLSPASPLRSVWTRILWGHFLLHQQENSQLRWWYPNSVPVTPPRRSHPA